MRNTIAYSGYTIAYSGYYIYTLSALRATILHYCSVPFRRKKKVPDTKRINSALAEYVKHHKIFHVTQSQKAGSQLI